MALPYLHARVGIARVGAALVGDAYPNLAVIINGVNKTTTVARTSVVLNLERSGPSAASFTISSRSGYVPSIGHSVTIGYAGAVAPLFAGNITAVEHQFEHDRQVTPWVEVTCSDYHAVLDRRLVTADLTLMTIVDAVTLIVDTYTTGLEARVKSGLDWLGTFTCENEAPSSVLTRIAAYIGGGWRIDSQGFVYLWDVNGQESRYLPPAPQSLISGRWSLRSFSHNYDWTQIRSRVIAEGYSTPLVVEFPSTVSFALIVTLPIEGASVDRFNTSAHADANFIRIGTAIFTYDSVIDDSLDTFTGLPKTGTVAAAAAPGDTSVTLDPVYTLGGSGWAHDGDGHYFQYGSVMGTDLITIPASGYGSITTPIAVGTVLYQAPILYDITVVSGFTATLPQGASIIVRAEVDDLAAQAAIAAVEGGDGIHEFFVSDDDASWNGALVLANSYLSKFSAALTRATWTTQDRNAMPNANQSIAVTLTGGLTDTLPIDRVTVTFPEEANNPFPLPLRQCEGGDVTLEGIIELLQERPV